MKTISTYYPTKGNSSIEFLLALPFALLVILLVLEFTMIFRTKLTLNHASAQVARAGSLNNACMNAMDDQLIRSLAPLEMDVTDSIFAYQKAAKLKKPTLLFYSDIDIISPEPEVFEYFKQTARLTPPQISGCARKYYRISSYALHEWLPYRYINYQPQKTQGFSTASGDYHLNIQEANLLKVRVRYCYRLKFPLVSTLIDAIHLASSPLDKKLFHNNCINGSTSNINSFNRNRFLVLESQGVARMQTPILKQSLKEE